MVGGTPGFLSPELGAETKIREAVSYYSDLGYLVTLVIKVNKLLTCYKLLVTAVQGRPPVLLPEIIIQLPMGLTLGSLLGWPLCTGAGLLGGLMQVVGQSFLFLHGRAAVHVHSQPVNGRVGTKGLQVWGPRGFPSSSEIGGTACSSTVC